MNLQVIGLLLPKYINVTCSEKRDLRDIFMNIEVLAWIDSSVYAEYNGASFKEKY